MNLIPGYCFRAFPHDRVTPGEEAVLTALEHTDPRDIFDALDADGDGLIHAEDLAALVENVAAHDPEAEGVRAATQDFIDLDNLK